MQVAVVILNWNGKKLLEQFLPGVLACSRNEATVYVADNASTDDSLAYVRANFPEIRVVVNRENYGFAGGYNRSLDTIEADVFVLLNSDVEVTPGWIGPVIRYMEKEPGIGACQPKILSFHQRDHFEYAGAGGGYIDRYGYPFCRGRIFNHLEKDLKQYDQPAEVFWASGACMFVRSSVFRQVNGFDETFFAHMEEIDLCWRIQRAGFSIRYQPAAVVYHVGGGTLPKSNPGKTYLNFRNNLLMLHKNLAAARLFPVMFYRMLLDGLAGIKFLFSSGPGDFFAVIRAHAYFYTHLRARLRIRRQTRAVISSGTVKGIYHGNLVVEYFIRGKKRFTDLNPNRIS